VLAGQLERRPIAGLELGVEGLRVGIAGNRAGTGIASTWWSGRRGSFELACDRSGRWRGEVSLDRHGDQGGWRILARGGSSAYRPLGDLRRVGPSRALTVAGVREGSVLGVRARTSALVSLWRFAPGLAGARVAGEWDQQLRDKARMIIGFEEQMGTRRDPRPNPTAARGAWRESDDHRRGLWLEWQSAQGPVGMGLRHEVWGHRWARDAVRRVTTARTEVELGHWLRLRLTHSVFQLERGEHVYVPEPGADRLVMRALSGSGERVRFELGCPFAQGEIRAAVHHQRGERTPVAEWTLDWTRRARVGWR
jgi:hypothetical protein